MDVDQEVPAPALTASAPTAAVARNVPRNELDVDEMRAKLSKNEINEECFIIALQGYRWLLI